MAAAHHVPAQRTTSATKNKKAGPTGKVQRLTRQMPGTGIRCIQRQGRLVSQSHGRHQVPKNQLPKQDRQRTEGRGLKLHWCLNQSYARQHSPKCSQAHDRIGMPTKEVGCRDGCQATDQSMRLVPGNWPQQSILSSCAPVRTTTRRKDMGPPRRCSCPQRTCVHRQHWPGRPKRCPGTTATGVCHGRQLSPHQVQSRAA